MQFGASQQGGQHVRTVQCTFTAGYAMQADAADVKLFLSASLPTLHVHVGEGHGAK